MEQAKSSIGEKDTQSMYPSLENISLPVGVQILGTLLPKEKSEFELSAEKHYKLSTPESEMKPKSCIFKIEEGKQRDSDKRNLFVAKIVVESKTTNFKKDSKITLHATYDGKNVEVQGTVLDVFPMRVTGEKTHNEIWINAIVGNIVRI